MVLQLVVERSGWAASNADTPKGHGRGLAVHFTFGSYCAQVADVSVDANQAAPHPSHRRGDRRRPADQPAESPGADRGWDHRRSQRGALRRDHDRARTHDAEHASRTTRCSETARRRRSTSTSCRAASGRPASARSRCRRWRRRWPTPSSPRPAPASGVCRSSRVGSACRTKLQNCRTAVRRNPFCNPAIPYILQFHANRWSSADGP